MKPVRIVENVYRRHIWVFACEDAKRADRFFRKHFPEVGPTTSTSQGRTVGDDDTGDLLVWIRRAGDSCTLVHELMHVVAMILRSRATPLTPDTDEAYAYLLQSLFISCSLALGKPGWQVWGTDGR